MIDQDACARIRVVQSGGFAGTVTLADVDRATLDPERARTLDQICGELSAASGADRGGEVGADLPEYRVEIEGANGATRAFTVAGAGGQGAAPGTDINALIGRLNRLAH